MLDITILILIISLFAGVLVGFHELNKNINLLKKGNLKISDDLSEIKIELENILSEGR